MAHKKQHHLKTLKDYKAILWDFDGVLLNSNAVRDLGFEEVLSEFPKEQVEELLDFHRANGGLSRYVKFRYFFEEVRGEEVTELQIQKWADRFSAIMRRLLVNPELLIQDSLNFVKDNHQIIPMHIVSGSDQNELRYLCRELDIAKYFISIHGSPTPKKELVAHVLSDYTYAASDCALIGDSINDYEAALLNGVCFYGYNNEALKNAPHLYLTNF
jgi:phosphoglycolate phosphatase-like HAD superfamily hydrolase